ncbi:VCBS repeat-containing protein [Streptomyces tubbatahanensis]|uniref:VCBS repeat-containing protein n=1 Tax=Streptomyces tubbatahanensis TaxID=2923272 RepID=A0ABY3XS23_9ACTN|nr:FG-GAP-like repeat-containing protein [Streptomyces tubbatahanensis]UNS97246.1 VCBS repeat-containing protein [Streptomyces tubbatahanensis]
MLHRNKATATATVARVIGVTAALLAGSTAVAVPAYAAPAAAADGSAAAASGAAAPKADFDGDGYADTVSGAPKATVAGKQYAGYLTVTYGSAKGTSTTKRQLFSANSEAVPGSVEDYGNFGGQTAARDFDGDGVTDLAVAGGGGAVILWGEKGKGLTSGSKVSADGGAQLAAGDFDGDGKADLALAGGQFDDTVEVLYGGFTREGKPARTGQVKTGHTFAPTSLTAGDVTGDGADDLVTTHAFEEMSESSEFYTGSKDGLVDKAQDVDDAETAVIADVNKDGFGDLVIRTVPGGVVEDLPHDHGTVKVLYGSAQGPSTEKTTTLTQNSPGVPGANEEGDEFGKALAAGDVNGDGYADIAVGVPGEDIGSGAAGKDTGAVVQLLGGKDGLTGAGAKNWDQGTAGVPGAVEAGDRFGAALGFGDTDNDGRDDLAVGAPGEDGDASATDAGAVWVLRGADGGLTADGVVSYGPKTLGGPEKGSGLGSAFSR